MFKGVGEASINFYTKFLSATPPKKYALFIICKQFFSAIRAMMFLMS